MINPQTVLSIWPAPRGMLRLRDIGLVMIGRPYRTPVLDPNR